jgi:hypothetical protein
MINNEIKELEIEDGKNENRKFYKKWEILTKTYKPRNRNIKARDGSVLIDEKGIITGGTYISEENRAHNHLNF